MEENEYENESISVESGSCNCSDYESDCSWFYDSRDLGTSYMRFCILKETENEESPNKDEKPINKRFHRNNEKLIPNVDNRRQKYLNIKKVPSFKKKDLNIDNNIDKSDYNDDNYGQNSFTQNYDNINYLETKNIPFKKKINLKTDYNNYNTNYNNYSYSDINNEYPSDYQSKTSFPEKYSEYEHNYSAPIELDNFHDKDLGAQRSPTNMASKRRYYYNLNKKKNEEKGYDNYNKMGGMHSPRNYYKNLKNIDIAISDDDNYDEEDENAESINVTNKVYENNGRTIKEKIIKEVKTITLEPGENIKPKMITKKKLKPITTIVKNDDGTQSLITENTVLTTVIVNEIVDSQTLYDDNYPIDVQLVKQYITKIYKTEIDNSPYP